MRPRRRCTECRSTFTPSPRALQTQRVCGPACRAARDRKLARARRRREIDDSRADERERQKACRAAREKARAAADPPACHAPPSASNPSNLPDKITQFVDRAIEASRASLLRDLRREWLRLRKNVAMPGPVSRRSFAAQVPDFAEGSAAIMAHVTHEHRRGSPAGD
jgi:hypothetical protein